VTWSRGTIQGFARSLSPAQVGDAAVADPGEAGLRIECRNDDESIKTSEIDWKDGEGLLRRKFLRVRVYNDSPRAVRECRVILQRVTEAMPGGPSPTDHDGPSLLIWSGDRSANQAGKVIRRNANPEVADLFYTVRRPSGGEIHLKDEAYSSFLRFGRWYDFDVVATATNMKPAHKTIKVRFGPSWDDFEVLSK
jgi:hypothetical protein